MEEHIDRCWRRNVEGTGIIVMNRGEDRKQAHGLHLGSGEVYASCPHSLSSWESSQALGCAPDPLRAAISSAKGRLSLRDIVRRSVSASASVVLCPERVREAMATVNIWHARPARCQTERREERTA